MYNAFKIKFDFLRDQNKTAEHLLQLKQYVLSCEPVFYSVIGRKQIHTRDGIMFAVSLDLELCDPNYQPAAECWINHQYFYVLDNCCWCVAVDKDGLPIVIRDKKNAPSQWPPMPMQQTVIITRPVPCNKTVILYHIGTLPVE